MTPQIRDALLAIAAANGDGTITPEQVVNAARSASSPLHSEFDWNDKTAGPKWRLTQARALIRTVRITFHTEKFMMKAPAFIRDPRVESFTQGYASVSQLQTDEDAARDAIIREFRIVASALSRARTIARILDMEGEIDGLTNQITSLSDRLSGSDAELGI